MLNQDTFGFDVSSDITITLLSKIGEGLCNNNTTISKYEPNFVKDNLSCFVELLPSDISTYDYQIVATFPNENLFSEQLLVEPNKWAIVSPAYQTSRTFQFDSCLKNSLEDQIVQRFSKFDKVKIAFYDEGQEFINIKILIQSDIYDYDLMTKIFEDAEFPIKDYYNGNKMINFEYVFNNQENYGFGPSNSKMLFGR